MRRTITILGILGVALVAGSSPATIDREVIRLRPAGVAAQEQPAPSAQETVRIGAPRRGFDYAAFQTQLESEWFQRKALLASGRAGDALEQLERIRSSCAEEGIGRLEHVAGALVSEARRDMREGSYERALTSLRVASALDPDRPQIHLLRAALHWNSDRAYFASARELLSALRATWLRSVRDLSLFHQLAFLVGVTAVGGLIVFALLMIVRYQLPFRHEVEEWSCRRISERWTVPAGWAALLLPLLTWIAAGWLALYWIVAVFRFMGRRERSIAVGLLLAAGLTLPAYRIGVALFGNAADPAVRNTLLSVGGEYDPDRVVRLRDLVDAHPDDPVYHFLLAGLYKNGRYFEEAFAEYRRALEIDPALYAVHVNIGNIFYSTGQFGEAIVYYGKAVELDPHSFLAHFNLHLAQSEDFRFRDAEESLRTALSIDPERVTRLLASDADRPGVRDESLELASTWAAALGGRSPLPGRSTADWRADLRALPLINPIGMAALAALVTCLVLTARTRRHEPARRCIRCGGAFCHRCKREKGEGREYCTQCLYLFVLGEGLAPGAKSSKMYEVERHERRTRRIRTLSSLVLPGAGQLLRGRTLWGFLLLLGWIAALVAIRPSWVVAVGGLVGLQLQPELLGALDGVPFSVDTSPLSLLAVPGLPMIWLLGNAWRGRRREA